MPWLILIFSAALQTVWVAALHRTFQPSGRRRLAPAFLFLVAILASIASLAIAMQSIPAGTAYAVWLGVGVVLTSAYAMITKAERLTTARLLLLTAIGRLRGGHDGAGVMTHRSLARLTLLGSAVLEAVWASALGGSNGLIFILPTLILAAKATLSMTGLGLAIRNVQLGTALRCVDVDWCGTDGGLGDSHRRRTPKRARAFVHRGGLKGAGEPTAFLAVAVDSRGSERPDR